MRTLFLNLSIAFAAVLTALFGAEMAIRLLIDRGEPWTAERYDHLITLPHYPCQIRTFHLPGAPPEGTKRIVALGDSFTWGDKVELKDAWPYVMERYLNEHGRPVEVANLGCCGFTTMNEVEMFEKFGQDYHPSLIVIGYVINDPLPSGRGFRAEGEDWLFPVSDLIPSYHRYLMKHSHLYWFLDFKYKGFQTGKDPRGFARLYKDDFSGWQQTKTSIARLAKLAASDDIPVIALIFPVFDVDISSSHYLYLDVHSKVRQAFESAGITAIDLRPLYAKLDKHGKDWWALYDDRHPNPEGHRLAGVTAGRAVMDLIVSKR